MMWEESREEVWGLTVSDPILDLDGGYTCFSV